MSVDWRWVSTGRCCCIASCFPAHFPAARHFPTNQRCVGGCHSPLPHFWDTHSSQAALLAAHLHQIRHVGTGPGRAMPCLQQCRWGPFLLPLLFIQLLGCKLKSKRKTIGKALRTCSACPRRAPSWYSSCSSHAAGADHYPVAWTNL